MNAVCDKCGKPATHKIVRIVDGTPHEEFFCDEHAEQADTLLPKTNLQSTLEQILSKLLHQANQEGGPDAAPVSDMRCGVCGLPFSAYRNSMILGCDRCYESFEDLLTIDVRKFHGATQHVGRRPDNYEPPVVKASPKPIVVVDEQEAAADVEQSSSGESPDEALLQLRKKMEKAVADEDFELAAILRDKIRATEAGPAGSGA